MFLDDGLGGGSSYKECLDISMDVKNTFESLGFLIAYEKCNWLPCQTLTWLGFCWNTVDGRIYVTEERIERLLSNIQFVLNEVSKGRIFFRLSF